MDKFSFWTIVSLVIIILCIIFIVYPFLNLIIQSFHDSKTETFTLKKLYAFLGEKYYKQALGKQFAY